MQARASTCQRPSAWMMAPVGHAWAQAETLTADAALRVALSLQWAGLGPAVTALAGHLEQLGIGAETRAALAP